MLSVEFKTTEEEKKGSEDDQGMYGHPLALSVINPPPKIYP